MALSMSPGFYPKDSLDAHPLDSQLQYNNSKILFFYGVHVQRIAHVILQLRTYKSLSPPPPPDPARPPQVVQELTYMGVWLRIPLVHPEAMDVDAGLGGDDEVKDSDVEAKSDGTLVEAKGNGQASEGDERTGASVEDPWETWNAIRVLCEHKSW